MAPANLLYLALYHIEVTLQCEDTSVRFKRKALPDFRLYQDLLFHLLVQVRPENKKKSQFSVVHSLREFPHRLFEAKTRGSIVEVREKEAERARR